MVMSRVFSTTPRVLINVQERINQLNGIIPSQKKHLDIAKKDLVDVNTDMRNFGKAFLDSFNDQQRAEFDQKVLPKSRLFSLDDSSEFSN
jgi:hypothetical protein